MSGVAVQAKVRRGSRVLCPRVVPGRVARTRARHGAPASCRGLSLVRTPLYAVTRRTSCC